MKKLLLTIVAAVLTAVIFTAVLFGAQKILSGSEDSASSSDGKILKNGCFITTLFPYTEEKNADGDNIAAIKIENNSDVNYRYMEISVKTDTANYSFLASTLPAYSQMTVLEENCEALPEDFDFESAEIVAFEAFEEAPSLMQDSFDSEIKDGFLYIKNITQSEKSSVTVYIKPTDDYGYFGGATYKLSVGSLSAGESKSLEIDMPSGNNPEIIFITSEDSE